MSKEFSIKNRASVEELTDLINSIRLENSDLQTENLVTLDNLITEGSTNSIFNNIPNSLNNQTTFNISESKMTALTLNIDPLKYLNKLPDFSGDYRDLQTFINLIDKIHPLLLRYDTLGQSIFSDIIKTKLKGKAREVMEINNHVTGWLEMKEILINNFGDSTSLEELFDKLRSVSFKTNCAEFYNEIKIALRRLNVKTRITLGEDLAISEQTITNNKNSALTIFKNKIPEPMRSILYCRNPDSLEAAMDILHESGYAYYNASPYNFRNNNETSRSNNRNRTKSNVSYNNNNNNTYRNNNNSNYNNNNSKNNTSNYNRNNNDSHINNRDSTKRNNNFSRFRNPRYNNFRNQHYQQPNPSFASQYIPSNQNFNTMSDNTPQYGTPNNPFRNNTYGSPNGSNNQSQEFPPPEPMDINVNELTRTQQPQNFPSQASPTSYLIS